MRLGPGLRRFALTAHVVASVGWLGAIGVFLALSVAGLTVDDESSVRAAYTAMDLTFWSVLVPLALASVLTGVIQGLGTKWGLLRHYWVVAKLLLTLLATTILLVYSGTIETMARTAEETGPLEQVRNVSPLLHAGAALVVLLSTTILAIYKPAGLTRYGWRRQQELRGSTPA